MSFESILQMMRKDELIKSENRLRIVAKIMGYKSKIKAGSYEVKGGTSSYHLLKQLVEGKVKLVRVTIPEGKNSRQIAVILHRQVEIDSAEFVHLVKDSAFIRKLSIDSASLEGYLFPDTYYFYWGVQPEEIIKVMVHQFSQQFDSTLAKRAKEMGFTLSQVLTLASIIEGEAVLDSEREIISAVYHNRLKKGIPLQADPTIQYIIPDGPRRLLKRDLAIDSPYNTYKYSGLPPGPINNPGLASIKASLYPAKVKYLYFVANGDGSHTFSKNLKEHLRAKSRFDLHRKKVKQQQKQRGDHG